MKRWKSALVITSVVLIVSILLFFLPPEDVFKHIPILNSLYKNTTLEVTVPNGKATVVINGKEYGETPVNIESLMAGEYDVTLKKVSSEESAYKEHTFRVNLTKNTTSRINMEIGPDENIHGSILYYTQDPSFDSNKGRLTVTSNIENSKVYMNSEFLKSTPITRLDISEGENEIKIEATNYESVSLPIVIRSGYTLNIKTYLLPIPVIFEETQSNE